MLVLLYTYDQILSICLNIIHEVSYLEHANGALCKLTSISILYKHELTTLDSESLTVWMRQFSDDFASRAFHKSSLHISLYKMISNMQKFAWILTWQKASWKAKGTLPKRTKPSNFLEHVLWSQRGCLLVPARVWRNSCFQSL